MQTQISLLKDKNILHFPNLKTVLTVEKVLRNTDGPINRTQLKQKLPMSIMHQTLNIILRYFEEESMIYDGSKGIIWIHEPNPRFQEILKKSTRVR